MHTRIAIALILLLAPLSPAVAQASAQVPEASSTTLFALGVLGLIVGRRLSAKRSERDD